jgi:hypothetical protein
LAFTLYQELFSASVKRSRQSFFFQIKGFNPRRIMARATTRKTAEIGRWIKIV